MHQYQQYFKEGGIQAQLKLTPRFGPSPTESLWLTWEWKPGLLAPRPALCPAEHTPCTYPQLLLIADRNEPSWHLPAPVQWRSGICQVWCPLPLRAGASSPSHVCQRALSARRDPGFQAELSHAIVPQNSSALRIFSKALMGQYVWFSTVSALAQVPLLGILPAFLLACLASGGRDEGHRVEEPWRW